MDNSEIVVGLFLFVCSIVAIGLVQVIKQNAQKSTDT